MTSVASCAINPAWVTERRCIPISVQFPPDLACKSTLVDISVKGKEMKFPFTKLVLALEAFSFQHNYEQSNGELWFRCGILAVAVLKWKEDELLLTFNQEREPALQTYTIKVKHKGPCPLCVFSTIERSEASCLEMYALVFLQHLVRKAGYDLGAMLDEPMSINVEDESQRRLERAVRCVEKYNEKLSNRLSVVTSETEARAPSILGGIRKNSPLLNERFKKRFRVGAAEGVEDASSGSEFEFKFWDNTLSLPPIAPDGSFPDEGDDLSTDFDFVFSFVPDSTNCLSEPSSPALGSSVSIDSGKEAGFVPAFPPLLLDPPSRQLPASGASPTPLTPAAPSNPFSPVASPTPAAPSNPLSPVASPTPAAFSMPLSPVAPSSPVATVSDSQRKLSWFIFINREVERVRQSLLPSLRRAGAREAALFAFYQEIESLRSTLIRETMSR